MGSNEFSELQAVDFALGAFISGAFSDLNKQRGTKEFQEFLNRPVKRQIYRHDNDGPAEFLKKFRAAKAAAKAAAGASQNDVELPVIYYFRKPGLTNGTDKEMTRRGRYSYNKALSRAYNLMALPVALDYKLFILAWDKPTLDYLQIAWYVYQMRNETFKIKYKFGDSEDIFDDIPVHLIDHKSILFSNESLPPDSSGRVYAVSMGLQISTDILHGAEIVAPDTIRMVGGLDNYSESRYVMGVVDGAYVFDSELRLGKKIPIVPGSVKIYVGSSIVGWDDENGVITGTDLTGTVDYVSGTGTVTFGTQQDEEVKMAFVANDGTSVVIASACPSCHRYGCSL